jgi:hypothetical protein
LGEWKDKDLKQEDVESVKSAISGARNAAMKIGQVMYNQQTSGQSGSGTSGQDQNQQQQQQQQQEGGEKKSDEKKE